MANSPNKLSALWQELKRRNVIKVIVMYAGGAFVLFDVANNVVVPLNLPDWIPRMVIIITLVGFPIAVVLSWIFDITPEGIGRTESLEALPKQEQTSPPGKRKLRPSDVIIGVLIVVVGILVYPRIFGSGNLNAMTIPVTVINEFGEKETRRVYKEDYLTRMVLFPFSNETNDSLVDWMEWGIMDAVFEDQHQFSNMLIDVDNAALLNEQIAYAREGKYPFFLTGEFRVDGPVYEITSRLYQTSNGSVRSEHFYQGEDFFSLIDSICVQVRKDLGVSEIILNATPDLPISDLITDHLDAYEYYIRGRYFRNFDNSLYYYLNRAIDIDSTFAKACYRLAYWCYNFQGGHENAVRSINQAIRHRSRLSEFSDVKAGILYYLIMGDPESVIKLSEYIYELRPRDLSLLYRQVITYQRLNLPERAVNLAIRMNELVPEHPPYQIMLADNYLLSGKPKKSLKVLNTLLADNPEYAEALIKMGEACLHNRDLEGAEEEFRKAIFLMPEYEKHWSMFLDHIEYVKRQKDDVEYLDGFRNTTRSDSTEFTMETRIINDQLFSKAKNQRGLFFYAVSDTVCVTTFKNATTFDFIKVTFHHNSQGKAISLESVQWSDLRSTSLLSWVEDSLIIEAKDLLAEGLTTEALAAFREAYKENPEHYYLANFIRYLEFITGPDFESSKSAFTGYAVSYGPVRLQIQNDRLYYTDYNGLIFELLPLSEERFMVPSNYGIQVQIVKEKGQVNGLKHIYRHGREEFFQRTSKETSSYIIE